MHTAQSAAGAQWATRLARSFRLACAGQLFLYAVFLPVRTRAQPTSKSSSAIAELAKQAEADLRDGKPELAVEDYRKILVRDPNNINAHSNLGLAEYLQGRFAAAAVELNAALRLKPDIWNDAALCGLSEAKTGENHDAELHLKQAFDHVADLSLRLAVGKQLYSILLGANQYERGAQVIDKLEELEPKDTDVLYAAHQIHSLLAEKAFLTMAQLQPDSARVYEMRGDRMAEIGNIEGAILAYRTAVERDPHLTSVHLALAEALSFSQNASERTEAESEYRKALAEDQYDEKAETGLGDIERQRSNLDAAEQHYKRALRLQPDDPDANEGLGIVLLDGGAIQEARAYLNRAVQLEPTNPAAYYHLSQASRRAGDFDEAKREMDEFLTLKAQKESLKRSFHDWPLGAARRTREAQEEQVMPPSTVNGPEGKPAQKAQ